LSEIPANRVVATATLAAVAVAVVPVAESVVTAAQEWALAVPGVELELRELMQALAVAVAVAVAAASTEMGPALRPSPTAPRFPVRMAVPAARVALARYLAVAVAGVAPAAAGPSSGGANPVPSPAPTRRRSTTRT
jgi:hypothetical protein